MKKCFLFLILIFFLLSSPYAQNYNIEGDKAVKEGKFQKALSYYSEGVFINDEYSINKVIDLEWDSKVDAKDLVTYIKQLTNIAFKNSSAAYLVGYFYYEGIEPVKKNAKEAFKYFKISAEAGNYKGIQWLAQCYYTGNGCDKSIANSVKWLTEYLKYQPKSSGTYSALASLYTTGDVGVPRDLRKALDYLKKAAIYGNHEDSLDFIFSVYQSVDENQVNEKSYNEEAFKMATVLYIKQHDLEAGYYLGLMLYSNLFNGLVQDEIKGKVMFQEIRASKSFTSALKKDLQVSVDCILGLLYYAEGNFDPEAFRHLNSAYLTDSTVFSDNLLSRYVITLCIVGGSLECKKALRLFNNIKNIDFKYDCYLDIANLYLDTYTCRDYSKANNMYQEIYSNQYFTDFEKGMACNQLGYMNFKGLLSTKIGANQYVYVTKDEYLLAIDWFEKGARFGNATSMDWLAVMYEKGNGVKSSKTKAIEWARKAVAAGNKDSQRIIDRLK